MPKVTIKVPIEVQLLPSRMEQAMKLMGIDQGELVKRSGVGQSTISRLLTGRETGGSVAHVVLVARALGVRVGWLVEAEEPMLAPARGPRIIDADAASESSANVPVRPKNNSR
jgi:transcriptional regulator with XRE-family HTH domain